MLPAHIVERVLDKFKGGELGLDSPVELVAEIRRSGSAKVLDGQSGFLAVALGDVVDDLERGSAGFRYKRKRRQNRLDPTHLHSLLVASNRGEELGRLVHGEDEEPDGPEEEHERAQAAWDVSLVQVRRAMSGRGRSNR